MKVEEQGSGDSRAVSDAQYDDSFTGDLLIHTAPAFRSSAHGQSGK
jgi:hypothetical protein